MNRFVQLSTALSLSALVAACSSSSSPSSPADGGGTTTGDDSGQGAQPGSDASAGADTGAPGPGTDASTPGTDAGTCAPSTLPTGDGGMPTFTAPSLGQAVCAATDISAFVTACGASGTGQTCGGWVTQNGPTTCGKCLASAGATIAPIETFRIGNQEGLLPSIGACILATAGSAAASCAVAADEGDYCVNYVCATCAPGTGNGCAQTASGGVCSSYLAGLQSACGSYVAAVKSCQSGQGSNASLTLAANGICGTGATDAGATDASDQ